MQDERGIKIYLTVTAVTQFMNLHISCSKDMSKIGKQMCITRPESVLRDGTSQIDVYSVAGLREG